MGIANLNANASRCPANGLRFNSLLLADRLPRRVHARGPANVLAAVPLQTQPATSPQMDQVITARKFKERRYLVEAYRVAGVTFEGRQGLVRQLQPTQIVMMEREPWNPYDKNAVRVTDLAGRTLGYIPRRDDANTRFVYETVFGMVASVGPAKEDNGNEDSAEEDSAEDTSKDTPYGVSIYARPALPGLLLDPLPSAEAARFADLPAAFGGRWPELAAAALHAADKRCEITGIPATQLPLTLLPHWSYNQRDRAVQLVQLMVVCESLAAAKAQLEQRVAAVASLGPTEASDRLREVQATTEAQLFSEVNGFGAEDAMEYFELVRRRAQAVAAEKWRVEALL